MPMILLIYMSKVYFCFCILAYTYIFPQATPLGVLANTRIGRGLKLKWSLENDFRSTNLGTTFSQWFHGAKDPIMLF